MKQSTFHRNKPGPHRALEILHRLREYKLEEEQIKLMARQREEIAREAQCRTSLAALQESYGHGEGRLTAHHYARRDYCIREAGVRHTVDLRQLGLAQIDRRAQVEETLHAKTRADMIGKVLEKRYAEDDAQLDAQARKEIDDISQSQFVHRAPVNDSF